MSNYVSDILTQEVFSNFCGSALWSSDLRTYLTGMSDMFYTHILIQYNKLYAMDFPNVHPTWIASYLITVLRNEFEKIFIALTWQYKPYFNYYRTIIERNSGRDSNTYSGADSIGKTGNDEITHSGTDNMIGNYEEFETNVTTTATDDTQYASTYDDTNITTMKPTVKNKHEHNVRLDREYNYDERLSHGEKIRTDYNSTITDTYGKILTMNFGRNVDTTIEGINGLFAPQDLITKELALRTRYRLFDIFTSMIVQSVSASVWESDE